MLTIDASEPLDVFNAIAESAYWQGYRIVSEKLPVADFVMSYKVGRTKAWAPAVGIESKTWNDLLSSIASKRLMSQLIRLQASFPASDNRAACLLIKGEREEWTFEPNPMKRHIRVRSGHGYRDTAWTVGEVEGFLLTVQDRGIKVLRCDNEWDLPAYLMWVYNHYARHKLSVDSFYSGKEVGRAMLDVIPGVTPELADRLIQQFKSFTSVFELGETELVKAAGVRVGVEIYKRLHS